MNPQLHNRAVLSATPNRSSTEALESRVSRLEGLVINRQSRGMGTAQPKTASAKTYPKLDVEQMRIEASAKAAKTAANIRALETKILQNFCGAKI